MWKFIRLAAGAALCALFCFVLLILAVGVFVGGSSSASGTLESGRSVSANSDSWYLSCRFQADHATIETAGHTILVGPQSLQVDGESVADIDLATKAVIVTVRDGAIEFVADNKPVAIWTE